MVQSAATLQNADAFKYRFFFKKIEVIFSLFKMVLQGLRPKPQPEWIRSDPSEHIPAE